MLMGAYALMPPPTPGNTIDSLRTAGDLRLPNLVQGQIHVSIRPARADLLSQVIDGRHVRRIGVPLGNPALQQLEQASAGASVVDCRVPGSVEALN